MKPLSGASETRQRGLARRFAFVWAAAMTAAVTTLILMPAELVPAPVVANQDKLEHVVVTAMLGALWTFATRSPVAVMACGAGFAMATELLQAAMAMGRTADVSDALVDIVGTALGSMTSWIVLAARSFRRDRAPASGRNPARRGESLSGHHLP